MIDKNDLLNILYDWNFWSKDQETGILRPIYVSKITKLINSGQVTMITGIRRSGKSYLMRQTITSLINSGVSKNNILFVNFEDARFPEELGVAILGEIFALYQKNLSPKREVYVFLDEVQKVKGWERWVRTMHELNKAKIIISGSNSQLMAKEFGTVLTGRHLDLTVFPLSYSEYLEFDKNPSRSKLEDYLTTGGFPVAVLQNDDVAVLSSYFEDILTKDLIKRFKIRKTEEIRNLARYYLGNPAGSVSFSKLGRNLNMTTDTAIKFSAYLETVYLNFLVNRFSWKFTEQEKSPKKSYVIDTGLAAKIGFTTERNLGFMSENIVYLEFLRRGVGNDEVFYYSDEKRRETDFVVKKLGGYEAFQVCWTLNRPEVKNREIKGLLSCLSKLKLDEGVILTSGNRGEEKIDGKLIKIIPLEEWLLMRS